MTSIQDFEQPAEPVPQPTIVVVGSTIVDLASYVPHLPAAGETVVAGDFLLSMGGKGANQAVMAALLGAHVHLVNAVGGDHFGRLTLENLQSLGVEIDQIVTVEDKPSGVATVWIDPSGENRIVIVPGANLALTTQHVDAALTHVESLDAVVCQLELPQSTATRALQIGLERGALTVLNPAPHAPLEDSLLEAAQWLVPNAQEFAAISAQVIGDGAIEPILERRVSQVAHELGKNLAVTIGPEGAIVCELQNDGVVWVPAPAVEAVDTVGAGDAFVGSFVYGLALGMSSSDSAAFACACASATVTRRGTQSSYPQGAQLDELRYRHLARP